MKEPERSIPVKVKKKIQLKRREFFHRINEKPENSKLYEKIFFLDTFSMNVTLINFVRISIKFNNVSQNRFTAIVMKRR